MMRFPNLKTYRLNAGLSATRLARISDVSRDTISKLERGQACRPHMAHLVINGLNEFYYNKAGSPIDPSMALQEAD